MDKLKIGLIVGVHGLNGELKVKSLTDFNDIRFKNNVKVYVKYNDNYIKFKITSSRTHKNLVLLVLDNMLDINLVEKYIGCSIYIDYSDCHKLEEDEVYYYQLMDCKVYDESGNFIGKVVNIIDTGANAILRVKNEREILIPYVNRFIVNHDIENKKIIVNEVEQFL